MEILTHDEEFFNKKEKDNILLDEAIITYVQNPDCTEDEDAEFQKLTISTRSNGIDKFLNIKADNWSIDNTEGLVKIIEDFKTRIGYE